MREGAAGADAMHVSINNIQEAKLLRLDSFFKQLAVSVKSAGRSMGEFVVDMFSGDSSAARANGGWGTSTTGSSLSSFGSMALPGTAPGLPSGYMGMSGTASAALRAKLGLALGGGKQGLDERTAAAKVALDNEETLAASMQSNPGTSTGAITAEIAKVDKLRRAYEALEAQKKKTGSGRTPQQELSDMVQRGIEGFQDQGAPESTKVMQRYDDTTRKLSEFAKDKKIKLDPSDMQKVFAAFIADLTKVAAKETAKREEESIKDLELQSKLSEGMGSFGSAGSFSLSAGTSKYASELLKQSEKGSTVIRSRGLISRASGYRGMVTLAMVAHCRWAWAQPRNKASSV